MSEQLQIGEEPEDPFDGISWYWREQAAAFNRRNPAVYALLVKYAREAVAAGRTRIGIELLWNRMRWDWLVQTDSDDYKLNQNFKAWYARLIMLREADLADIFETRRRQP
jgi:hypothetical protein